MLVPLLLGGWKVVRLSNDGCLNFAAGSYYTDLYHFGEWWKMKICFQNTCHIFIGWLNKQIKNIYCLDHKYIFLQSYTFYRNSFWKPKQRSSFTWKSLPYDCSKYCCKYLSQSIPPHLSPPSSPVQPPAGSPLVAGPEKPEEAPGRNWGGPRGGPEGTEVGNRGNRGEAESDPPTESGSLESPISYIFSTSKCMIFETRSYVLFCVFQDSITQ